MASPLPAPHRAYKPRGGQSLTNLEAAFRFRQFDYLDQWHEQGVIHDAIQGRVKNKKRYISTLMDNLLYPFTYQSWGDTGRVLEWAKQLWAQGAHERSEYHGAWLALAAGTEVADYFMSEGVSPHFRGYCPLTGSFQVNPVEVLMGKITRSERGQLQDDVHSLKQQLLQMIATPGADPYTQGRYYADAFHHALFGGDDVFWSQVRQVLLSSPISMLSEIPGAQAHAFFSNMGRSSRVHTSEWIQKNGGEGTPTLSWDARLSMEQWDEENRLKAKAHQILAPRTRPWMEAALAQLTPLDISNSFFCNTRVWGEYLNNPDGVWMGRQLLERGVKGPWAEPPRSSMQEQTLLGERMGGRNSSALQAFVQLVDGFDLDKRWVDFEVKAYVGTSRIERQAAPTTDLSLEELSHLAHLIERVDPRPPIVALAPLWSAVAEQWTKGNADEKTRKGIIDFFRERGVFQNLIAHLDRSLADEEGLGLDGDTAEVLVHTINFLQQWRQGKCLAHLQCLEELSPHLPMLLAQSYVLDNKKEAHEWVANALDETPEKSSYLIKCVARNAFNRNRLGPCTDMTLHVLSQARERNLAVDPNEVGELLLLFLEEGAYMSWPQERQESTAELFIQCGVDVSGLSGLAWRAMANRQNAITQKTLLLPMAGILLEAGLDPLRVPKPTNSSPLDLLLTRSQAYASLNQHTGEAAPPRPRRRM